MTRVERRITAAAQDRPLPLTAVYDPADPFAVTFKFPNGIEWTFARDLLAEGLVAPAGDQVHGDIVFLPRKGAVEVALSSPCGHIALTFQKAALAAFLEASEQIVPLGEERIDWDRELRALGGSR